MSQQAINSEAVPKDYEERTGRSTTRRFLGESIVAVRVDDLPASEAERLAAEGKWYPLTVDQNGQLRVVTPDWIKVHVQELEVLRDSRDLLMQIRDLLMKIA